MDDVHRDRPLKFRILTPSFNQAQFVERAVRSVLAQELDGIELDYIVYDAMSTDGSQAILRKLAAEFPQMTLNIAPDGGQADALHKGFTGSDAEVIGWLNADDVLLPGALECVAREMRASAADVVYGEALFIDENDRIIGVYPTCSYDHQLLKSFCFISQPSTFFRSAMYRRAGEIDRTLRFCMDYILWLRLASAGARFRYIRRKLSATRKHPGTKTNAEGLAFTSEVCQAIESELGFLPREWLAYKLYRESLIGARSSARHWVFLKSCVLVGLRYKCTGRLIIWALRVFRAHQAAYVQFRLAPHHKTVP